MRLTQRGAAVLATSPVLALAAWLLGLPEAAVLSACAALLVLLAAVWTKVSTAVVDIQRSVLPTRPRVGEPCRVQLRILNTCSRSTAPLLLTERIEAVDSLRLQIAPVPSGEQSMTSYNFPTHVRGRQLILPTTVQVEDPFGLLRSTHPAGTETQVLVLPRLWPLSPLPAVLGQENLTPSHSAAFISRPAEEFAGLREYLPGDDLRRIHWPTTARTGRPVMRQFELPLQHRTTVLLDLMSSASFERSVSAAASVVALEAEQGGLIRLVTTAAQSVALNGIEFVNAADQFDQLQDRLALVEQSPKAVSIQSLLQLLDAQDGGRLVICAGSMTTTDLGAIQRGSRQFSSRVLLTSSGSEQKQGTNDQASEQQGWLHLDWPDGSALNRVWDEATRSAAGAKQ
ncbi:hypothetical protein IMCC26207_102119 [Actinobacteria bacterium IMCC26207]|nr:hypothetical protein IMCC26207_102119 [Actinobacteria bacterium IMCC26207]